MRTRRRGGNRPGKFAVNSGGTAIFSYLLAAFISCLSLVQANAQCAMCRAALETNGQAAQGEAVNNGIVYLMVIPYLAVAVLIYFVYITGKKLKKN